MKELQEEELYTYLGQDEAVGYDGILDKEKVTKEYKRRVWKIWTSELYSGNKVTAHNTFAVPLIMPTIGILNWTRKEIEDLDKVTRRIMCYTGNLYMRSDINRIYVLRKLGGRGLASIEDSYTALMISLAKHIEEAADTNAFMKKVKQHEQENIIRLKEQLLEYHNIKPEEYTKQAVKTKLKQDHLKAWKIKPLRSYLFKKFETDDKIDHEASNQWLHSEMSSHVEVYINAMQEQEIATKSIKKRRNKDQIMNSKCRPCETQEETVPHVLGECPSLSTNLYISVRHDNVGQIIVEEVLKQENINHQQRKRPELVIETSTEEIWWNMAVTTTNKVEYNRPDVLVWEKESKLCHVIEISIPLDFTTSNRQIVKRDKYMPLVSEMQRMYQDYKFQIVPVIIGFLGAIPKSLVPDLKKLGLDEPKQVIRRPQKTALLVPLKIMKTFIKMKTGE